MHRTQSAPSAPRGSGGLRRIRTLIVASVLAIAGCSGGSDSAGPNGISAGEYVLAKVDLETLPATIHNGPWLDPVTVTFWNHFHYEITGAVLELDGDDRFILSFDWSVVADGEEYAGTVSAEGSYEVDGDEIWLASDDEGLGSSVGTIAGRTITFEVEIMNKGVTREFVFQR